MRPCSTSWRTISTSISIARLCGAKASPALAIFARILRYSGLPLFSRWASSSSFTSISRNSAGMAGSSCFQIVPGGVTPRRDCSSPTPIYCNILSG